MKRAIEVRFYVLEEEVITKKIKSETVKKINELLPIFEERYNKIAKVFDYSPDWGDSLDTFLVIFRKRLITDVASITFKSKDDFEEVALRLIEPTMKEAINGQEFIDAICEVIKSQMHKSFEAHEKLKLEEMIDVLKVYF